MHFSRSTRVSVIASLCAASLLALAVPSLAQSREAPSESLGGAGAAAPVSSAPLIQSRIKGREIIGQLRSSSPSRPIPVKKKLSSRQRAIEARRIAKMTPAQRKRMVQKKYNIAPRGWLASYLPADRYKFGKVWQYVSTETDRHYYRPQDMARRRFNANKVIGFRTWQMALAAGYTPDPVSKPAPGAQVLALSQYAKGPNFYRFVEYTYAGQVAPGQFEASYNYARKVANALRSSREGRRYMSNTLDRVFQAIVEGNPNLIPRTVGGPPPAPATAAGGGFGGPGIGREGRVGPTGAPSGTPEFPGSVNGPVGAPLGSPSGSFNNPSAGRDGRVGQFNQFGQRAGGLSNVPSDRR